MLRLEWLTGGVLKTVESKEFGFYNRDGTRVFLMDKDKFGYPNLILMDLKKNYRMGVMVLPEGEGTPGLVFYDSSGLRGHLRMTGDQASVLKLTGAKEKGSILLSVSAEGDPRLIMTDKSGKVMFAVPEGASETKPQDAAAWLRFRLERPASRPWRLSCIGVNSKLIEEFSFHEQSRSRECALLGLAAMWTMHQLFPFLVAVAATKTSERTPAPPPQAFQRKILTNRSATTDLGPRVQSKQ